MASQPFLLLITLTRKKNKQANKTKETKQQQQQQQQQQNESFCYIYVHDIDKINPKKSAPSYQNLIGKERVPFRKEIKRYFDWSLPILFFIDYAHK